ncbi:hypothetical protein IWW42_002836 [Coemansia sp. RSA 1085]|nr:alpha/beta hydrolase fold-domain-containing protein [Coemansia mojavensis]KAJ1740712.1 hypothetical protein LPJ68_003507 [Coemansia sp. RSA 1086]KAJ2672471.1 hypothetical protein IWW42_002836 [Coemansia sp. RSA 1085]
MIRILCEVAQAAYIALTVSIASTWEYVWHGPRLPKWDLKFQLTRDIMHSLILAATPQYKDDRDIDKINVYAIAESLQNKPIPAPKLSPGEGSYHIFSVPAQQASVNEATFKNVGIHQDRFQQLCRDDLQGAERQIGCEMVVAAETARQLKHMLGAKSDLLACRPLYPEEKVLVYIHGGGFIVGNAASCRQLVCRLSREAGVRALVVDYRLAPQNPFPAPLYDVYIAYLYLLQQGFMPERIVVAGDSAGGNLSLALVHLAQMTKAPKPGGLVLLSPLSDAANDLPSCQRNRNYDILAKQPVESPLAYTRLYYAPGQRFSEQMRHEMADLLVSPVNGDFAMFPPTLIQCGTHEVLIDDIIKLHAAIQAQSPETAVLEQYQDMLHVFHVHFYRPESIQAVAGIGRFIRDL